MTGSLTKKSAVVFGGSGLTGRFLTEMLANDSRFGEVTAMNHGIKTNPNERRLARADLIPTISRPYMMK
ncbi:hypothetical protein MASR1M74_04690 [Lentimicrobium sp.]